MFVRFARCWLWLGLLALAAVSVRSSGEQPSRDMLGKKVPNLRFRLVDGKTLSLYDLENPKSVVLVFLSFDCPISANYSQPLAEIHKEFQPYGVTIIGLTTNEEQTPQEVARLVRDYKIPFPVAIDHNLTAADALKANITPEVFVLDSDWVLRYRGRIDDAYYARLKRNHQVSCHDLRQVLGELMSGRPVSTESTVPIGCPIPRDLGDIKEDGPITYHRDVRPILQEHCQQCHRPGQIGPFALSNFRQAVNWAKDIHEFTRSGFMPPWKARGDVPMHGQRGLTEQERLILAQWVAGGTPRGTPVENQPEPVFAEGWRLGKPDLVLTVPGKFELGPSGHDLRRCFVLPTGLKEDKLIRAIEVLPGNARIVQHALFFADTTGNGRTLEEREAKGEMRDDPHHRNASPLDTGSGYTVMMGTRFEPAARLGGWSAGAEPVALPEGFGYPLPAGSDLVVQIHYHRTGRLEEDQTRIGLYFTRGPQATACQEATLSAGDGSGGPAKFTIPAGAKNHRLTGAWQALADCQLFSLMPHMHYLGKDIKLTVTDPAGKTITVLAIDDWDYTWQEMYYLKEPLRIAKGSRITLEATYNNSGANPRNPYNPPRDIHFGELATDEMGLIYLTGTSSAAGKQLPLAPVP